MGGAVAGGISGGPQGAIAGFFQGAAYGALGGVAVASGAGVVAGGLALAGAGAGVASLGFLGKAYYHHPSRENGLVLVGHPLPTLQVVNGGRNGSPTRYQTDKLFDQLIGDPDSKQKLRIRLRTLLFHTGEEVRCLSHLLL